MRLGGYEIVQQEDRVGTVRDRLQLSHPEGDFRRTSVALLDRGDMGRNTLYDLTMRFNGDEVHFDRGSLAAYLDERCDPATWDTLMKLFKTCTPQERGFLLSAYLEVEVSDHLAPKLSLLSYCSMGVQFVADKIRSLDVVDLLAISAISAMHIAQTRDEK